MYYLCVFWADLYFEKITQLTIYKQLVHCTKNTISQKWNCFYCFNYAALFPIPTFMYLWAIFMYIPMIILPIWL